MNFSEFKKLIGADPWNRDPETLRARNSGPEFEAAAADAEAFEKKLQASLNIQPPADLLENIQDIARQPARKQNWMPLALAASLLIVVGAASLAWRQAHHWDSVEEYLEDHYSHDGAALVAKATDIVAGKDVMKILAKLDATADQGLIGTIRYIKFCPTPNGRGAHMVVSTDQGLMTIIFMPKTRVTDGEWVKFDQMHALLVDLDRGSVAIIGEQSQKVEALQTLVRDSLKRV